MKLETILIHAGEAADGDAVIGPIHRSTTYRTRPGESYADVRYGRLANTPQPDRLHARLAAACGGQAALSTSSGMAAVAAEALVTLPTRTSHATLTPTQRAALGISDRLVRLSVGLEAPEDLLADLGAALARSLSSDSTVSA